VLSTVIVIFVCFTVTASGQNDFDQGKRLFEVETFGGNGRTCRTCHSKTTGTISPNDVQKLFKTHPGAPLFVGDGSDDGYGNGASRVQTDATILMRVPWHQTSSSPLIRAPRM
jgi:hypothetical protein